jgi:hypothetical protein
MPTLISRDVVWPGQLPTNTNGTPRPKLAANRPILTIHYTGSPPNYGDFGDTIAELRGIQAWAQNAGKPWEYNFVVDTEGVAWTYAGEYRAAHSAGNNDIAVGVLLLLGVTDPPTGQMIATVRWLRHHLQNVDLLASPCQTKKHKDMGTTPTSCPGPLVEARWSEFLVPWIEPPSPPPTPPEDDMAFTFVAVRPDGGTALVSHDGAGCTTTWLDDREPYLAQGIKKINVTADEFDRFFTTVQPVFVTNKVADHTSLGVELGS